MPRDFENLDPSLLAELDMEADFAATVRRRTYMPRLQLERGQGILIRYLPVQIGTTKHWLGRFAQHWVHKRAVFCRALTAESLGGDHTYKCPSCAMLLKASGHANESIRKRASECMAEPKWYGVVVPLARDTGKGTPTAIGMPECRTAMEFHMYRTIFDQLRTIAARFAIAGTQGIVDIHTGQDIWVNRTARGYVLSPAGKSALYEEGEDFQKVWDQIFDTVTLPTITMPDTQQESEFFHKIKEYILTGGGSFDNGGNPRSSRSAAHAPVETDLDGDGGPPPSRAGRQFQPPPREELDDSDLDSADMAPPAPISRPAPQRPPVQEPPRSAPQPAPVQEPPHEQLRAAPPVTAPPPPQPARKGLIPQPVRRSVPPQAAATAPPPAATVPPAAAATTPPPAAHKVPISGATPDDEDADIAPEAIDPAPPIAGPAELDDAPPPPVQATGTRLKASLADRLANYRKEAV